MRADEKRHVVSFASIQHALCSFWIFSFHISNSLSGLTVRTKALMHGLDWQRWETVDERADPGFRHLGEDKRPSVRDLLLF